MRTVLRLLTVMASAALLFTGCDFFRAVAGRPTSKDIEAKREVIRQEEEAKAAALEAARADSVRRADSLSLAQAASLGTEKAAKPGKKRFYIMMGAFSSQENASRYADKLSSMGYETEFFGFTEGRTAVGIGGTDDEHEAKEFFKELKRQDFCPAGVWILDRKRK